MTRPLVGPGGAAQHEGMTTTLITGANKGLGREAARRLIEQGHTVWVGARDEDRGRAAADELGARFVQLDVTDDASVDAAVATVKAEGGLDVLVNNAGISGGGVSAQEITADDVREVYETNVFGVVRTLHAFAPLLERSDAPVVVNVSSGLGSHAVTSDPDRLESTLVLPAYTSSKAALNMLTAQYAKGYPGMRVNCVDPGYTATEFNGNSGPQTVQEGTDAIVAAATVAPDGPTGTYFDREGPLAW
jgi:NAD(P)-dependent dehydrogenase (short-subunit alcohol dehydrogenase family)